MICSNDSGIQRQEIEFIGDNLLCIIYRLQYKFYLLIIFDKTMFLCVKNLNTQYLILNTNKHAGI